MFIKHIKYVYIVPLLLELKTQSYRLHIICIKIKNNEIYNLCYLNLYIRRV